MKGVIVEAASEALGLRKKRRNKRGLYLRNEDSKCTIQNEKELYLKYLSHKNPYSLDKYNTQRRQPKSLVKITHKESWERYVSRIENDVGLHKRQNAAQEVIKKLNKYEKDAANLKLLKKKNWAEFCKRLWYSGDEGDNEEEVTGLSQAVDCTTDEALKEALCNSKSKKGTGADNINIELYKCIKNIGFWPLSTNIGGK